ncbi:DUF4239 domain-containing protein [Candidatus Methylospira mobilis]|uniref:DUF4239 domain-containing protein n=1 Tax=Candidatus Methylospira mobilis TaxID=1808979 RepID=A0A5Q0BK24_9GAMM|nr:DUF4239 domain-containing protein [Candidatus Methylospira mobilis]QFY42156.1 DUF4239 domain-containing protein [Candidatus Methylospira mobilis]WNV03170.1 DUF4239 domain-containing protein [Candidatus Methylospira mobilis]
MSQLIYSQSMLGLIVVIVFISMLSSLLILLFTVWLKRQFHTLRTLERDETFFNAAGLVFSLLLAFVTVSVWENYQDTVNAVDSEARSLNNLRLDLDVLRQSQQQPLVESLNAYTHCVIDHEWHEMAGGHVDNECPQLLGQISHLILTAEAQTEGEKRVVGSMVDLLNVYRNHRMERLTAMIPALDKLMWSVLILSTAIYFFYGSLIDVGRLRPHSVLTLILAMMIGLVFVLIAAYDLPFTRPLSLQPEALQSLLQKWEMQGLPVN